MWGFPSPDPNFRAPLLPLQQMWVFKTSFRPERRRRVVEEPRFSFRFAVYFNSTSNSTLTSSFTFTVPPATETG